MTATVLDDQVIVEFCTDSLSEFKIITDGDHFVIERRTMLGVWFQEWIRVTDLPTVKVGESVAGVDINNNPFTTSHVMDIIVHD